MSIQDELNNAQHNYLNQLSGLLNGYQPGSYFFTQPNPQAQNPFGPGPVEYKAKRKHIDATVVIIDHKQLIDGKDKELDGDKEFKDDR